jgi:hypothetical protein
MKPSRSTVGSEHSDDSHSSEPLFLAACTMVSEGFQTVPLTKQWVQHTLANGVEHVLVYLDSNGGAVNTHVAIDVNAAMAVDSRVSGKGNNTYARAQTIPVALAGVVQLPANRRLTLLESDLLETLAEFIVDGRVAIVFFHQAQRGPFETQQLMEAHCLWRQVERRAIYCNRPALICAPALGSRIDLCPCSWLHIPAWTVAIAGMCPLKHSLRCD